MNTDTPATTAQWDDAYDNSKSVGGSDHFVETWQRAANQFRERTKLEERGILDIAYGDGERNCFDLFLPDSGTEPLGLVMFVHGGYWMRLEGKVFSHFANGPTSRGWCVAVPSYDLCPSVEFSNIPKQIAKALEVALEQTGNHDKPVRLIGHSAGGHLVTRLVSGSFEAMESGKENSNSNNAPLLSKNTLDLIEHVVSVSGLHDLRPLLKTSMNKTLGLDTATAHQESPALLTPVRNMSVTCWVGADELSELKRQSLLLANIWKGLGVPIEAIAEPSKNHFDVIAALSVSSSPLVSKLLS